MHRRFRPVLLGNIHTRTLRLTLIWNSLGINCANRHSYIGPLPLTVVSGHVVGDHLIRPNEELVWLAVFHVPNVKDAAVLRLLCLLPSRDDGNRRVSPQ